MTKHLLMCSMAVLATVVAAGLPMRANSQSDNAPSQTDTAALTSLKEIGDLCHHIKGAAKNLASETEQPNFVYVGNPDMMGSGLIQTTGTLANPGYLPPRPKWVKFHMSHLTELLPELKTEVQSLQGTATVSGAAELVADMQNELTNAKSYFKKLVAETKGPKYDSMGIQEDSNGMGVVAENIDKDRKDLEKIVRKSSK